jgi:hypothetical protein
MKKTAIMAPDTKGGTKVGTPAPAASQSPKLKPLLTN